MVPPSRTAPSAVSRAWRVPTASIDLVHAAGQLADAGDALLAALGDHVGGAELAAQAGAGLVAAGEHDPLGAEPLGGDHRAQADRAVPDDQHRIPAADAGGDGAVVAGGHHVGQRQQRRQQRGVGGHRQLHQGAVGVRDADGFALPAVDAVEAVPPPLRHEMCRPLAQ